MSEEQTQAMMGPASGLVWEPLFSCIVRASIVKCMVEHANRFVDAPVGGAPVCVMELVWSSGIGVYWGRLKTHIARETLSVRGMLWG